MGNEKNKCPQGKKKNNQTEMKKHVIVTVKNKRLKGSKLKHLKRISGVPAGHDHFIDIAAKKLLKVERPECRALVVRNHPRDIKREIELIEHEYYSSNAAVDRIMSRKFGDLVRIYLKRQSNRIKGRE